MDRKEKETVIPCLNELRRSPKGGNVAQITSDGRRVSVRVPDENGVWHRKRFKIGCLPVQRAIEEAMKLGLAWANDVFRVPGTWAYVSRSDDKVLYQLELQVNTSPAPQPHRAFDGDWNDAGFVGNWQD